jgi:hypothetical protein
MLGKKICVYCGKKAKLNTNNICTDCQKVLFPLFQRDTALINESLQIMETSRNKETILGRRDFILAVCNRIQVDYLDIGIELFVDIPAVIKHANDLLITRLSE